jgi:hypothetical protein
MPEKKTMSTGNYVSVREARIAMAYHLGKDPELCEVYVSNVANFLADHCGMKDHKERNQKAADLLEMLFTQ